MRRTLTLLLALLATLGLLSGCGTSGGDDSAGTTTTKAADDAAGSDDGTDSTEPADDGTETTEPADDGGSGSAATVAELEDLLPTADDVPSEYTLDDSDDGEDSSDGSDDAMDEQFKEACPGLEQLDFLDTSSDDETAQVTFSDPDDRELSVELDPANEDFTEDNIGLIVDAFADCDEVSLTDEDGVDYTISIQAEEDGSRGDFGMRLDMHVAIDFLGTPIELDFAGQAFSVDGVSAFVSTTSGISETETDFTAVPLDEELLGDISDLMENRLNDR